MECLKDGFKKKKNLSGFLPQESAKATEKSICLGLCRLPQHGNQMGSLLNPVLTYFLILISPFSFIHPYLFVLETQQIDIH